MWNSLGQNCHELMRNKIYIFHIIFEISIILSRQPTPYDDYCNQIDEHGAQIGSRVYGDCDRLMKLVMRFILGEDHIKEWEEGRDQRIALYDMTRT